MQSVTSKGFQLSLQQARLWSYYQENGIYRSQCAVRVEGALNGIQFQNVLQRIVSKYTILRSTFRRVPGINVPLQVISDSADVFCRIVDLEGLSESAQIARFKQHFTTLQEQVFDLENGPLFQVMLLRLAPHSSLLLLGLPAFCADASTLKHLVVEIQQEYALEQDEAAQVAEEPLQYIDVAAWQNELLQAEEADGHYNYWRAIDTSQLSTFSLPFEQVAKEDMTDELEKTFLPQTLAIELEVALVSQLRTVAQQASVSVEAFLLACWQAVLWRLTETTTCLVGVARDGRHYEELSNALGLYTRYIPFSCSLAEDLPFERVLQLVQAVLAEATERQEYFIWETTETIATSQQKLKFFPIDFEYETWPTALSARGVVFSFLQLWSCIEPFFLKLRAIEVGERVQLEVHYDSQHVTSMHAQQLFSIMHTMLLAVLADPQVLLGSLPLLSSDEQLRIQQELNGAQVAIPTQTLSQCFEVQVQCRPSQVAIVCGDEQLTYQQLNQQANRLAHFLRREGVRSGLLVGLCMERSVQMIVGMLAILKAGGAYVPLDPDHPIARVLYQLQDIGSGLVLTQERLLPRLSAWDGRAFCLDSLPTQWIGEDETDLDLCNDPQDLAYVIYTSGTSGQPKGVMIRHESVNNYIQSISYTLAQEVGLHFATVSTLAADLGNTVIFCALSMGGTLHILPYEMVTSGEAMARYIAQHPIDVLKIVPAHLSFLLTNTHGQAVLPRRYLLLGGEALSYALLAQLRERSANCCVVNHYGPTETTIGAVLNILGVLDREEAKGDAAQKGSVPIGRPLANTRAFILDRYRQQVPRGMIGELYLGGAGLAAGYLHHPELTRERFVIHLFAHEEVRLYRTGDLVRCTEEGQLVFVGRVDDQVKVLGNRIELSEIAEVLCLHENIREAVVVLREDNPGAPQLVAYVVAMQQPQPTQSELRHFMEEHVPRYMVPSAVIFLRLLPLTSNGKVNRHQLPSPQEYQERDASAEDQSPRSPIEEMLVGIWQDILKVKVVGIHSNFAELGGHSLLATQIISRLRRLLQVDIPLRSLFEAPTVAGLARHAEQALRQQQVSGVPLISPVPREQNLPLSFAQQRLWFLDQLEPGLTVYTIPTPMLMLGRLDSAALQRSLKEVVRRHEILRTTFHLLNDQPVQVIDAKGTVAPIHVDLRGLQSTEREREARTLADQEGKRPFVLAQGPLFRVTLLHLNVDEHVILMTMHHIISDGWSRALLIHELSTLYNAFIHNSTPHLLDLPVQYADFAVWQRRWLQGEVLGSHLHYWANQLSELVPLELPTDYPRPVIQTFHGALQQITLAPTLLDGLKSLSLQEDVTLFMTLLAAFQVLLARYSGQDDIAVGSLIANRTQAETENMLGFFTNTLVLRTHLAGNPTFQAILARVREVTLGAYAHQDVPFEKLVEELQPERDLSRSSLFQVMCVLQNAPRATDVLHGLTLSNFYQDVTTTKFDLSLTMAETEQGLSCAMQYNVDLFEADTIHRLLEHFQVVLASVVAQPELALAAVPLLGESEQQKMSELWDMAHVQFPVNKSLHQLFEEQVQNTPEKIALVFGDQYLTYAALDQRANQLAQHLQTLGVGPEILVGICVERSLELIIGLLGILKAGGAYLPLDPTYSRERLTFMLQDAQATVLLSQQSLLELFPDQDIPLLCLDADWPTMAQQVSANLSNRTTALNLAYVIYTSGSTGRPKGVAVTHHNVVHSTCARLAYYAQYPVKRFLLTSSVSFDSSIAGVFGTLCQGATLVLPPENALQDIYLLFDLLQRQHISHMLTVPSFYALMLLQEKKDALANLEVFIVAGETCTPALVERHYAVLPQTVLYNEYGPTEATVWSSVYQCQSQERKARVAVGRAVNNVQLYVLDTYLRPVPIGVPGELFIGGMGVTRAYLNCPEATAERFIPNPFSEEPGTRLYRSGDLVRYRSDENIEFLGRNDQQVKLHGYRIELEEIETVLNQYPGIQESIATIYADKQNNKQLVAYVTQTPYKQAGGTEKEQAQESAYISQFQGVYDQFYSQDEAFSNQDQAINKQVWTSSYTNLPLGEEEVLESVEDTIARVTSLAPQHVLEIGCGTGLLLFRIAPHCVHYTGVDISNVALQHLQAQLSQQGFEKERITLLQRAAHELYDMEKETFDAIIINEVVQHFPNIDYLLRVIQDIVPLVKAGGTIFIGGLRSLAHLRTFHTSVQLYRASSSLPVTQLQQRIEEHLALEKDLVIDPAFFSTLPDLIPTIGHVQTQLKGGSHSNEITRFKYDVTLYIGDAQHEQPSKFLVLDWQQKVQTVSALRQLLLETRPDHLGITGVPNARLLADSNAQMLMRQRGKEFATVGDLRKALAVTVQESAIDPNDFWAIERDMPYTVEVSWSDMGGANSYNLLFSRRTNLENSQCRLGALPGKVLQRKPLREYANDPLQGRSSHTFISELRSYLREKLPHYMVPTFLMLLETFPRTSNGKVNRRALPVPELSQGERNEGFRDTYTPIQEVIMQIWADILGRSQIGIDDNFFDLGGHSLLATQVFSRIRKVLGVEVAVRSLFEAPTVMELAVRVEQEFRRERGMPIPPLVAISRARSLPLSFSQQRLWFLDQFQPGQATYNVPRAVRIHGVLDMVALQQSFREIVRRHESLRTVFHVIEDQPVQVIEEPENSFLQLVDLSMVKLEQREAEARKIAQQEAQSPFDLSYDRLLRTLVLRLHPDDHILLLTMHHIISDGWSMGIFIREVSTLYDAFAAGRPSPLPDLSIQYADFAVWQRELLQGEVLETQIRYWKKQLDGLVSLDLPTDYPRPAVQTFDGARSLFTIPASLRDELRRLSQREGVTLFMTLLAAFQVLLARYTGQTDIAIGTDIANRTHAEIEGLIGFFVNTLVLRADLSGDPSFLELLERVREMALESYVYQDIPFDKLVEVLRPERELAYSPLFQVMLSLQQEIQGQGMQGLALENFSQEIVTAKFDLSLWITDTSQGLSCAIEYNTNLFAARTITQLLNHFQTLLAEIVAHPEQSVTSLTLLSKAERHQLLVEWNSTAHPDFPLTDIATLFSASVAQSPERIAAVMEDVYLTYAELDQRAELLGRILYDQGVGPEVLVGLYLERSLDMLISMLAVFKVGGAYVPLDPAYPQERLAFILADAQIQVIITKEQWQTDLPESGATIVCLKAGGLPSLPGTIPSSLPALKRTGPHTLAYVIYTSGSTGRPKGVMVTQIGMLNHLWAKITTLELQPQDRVGQTASHCFDISVWQFLAALLCGGQVQILPDEVAHDPQRLFNQVAESNITILELVPSLLRLALEEPDPLATAGVDNERLRWLLVTGEALPAGLCQRWFQLYPRLLLVNAYGPTECSDDVTQAVLKPDSSLPRATAPIGKTLANLQVYVLDGQLTPVPIGVPGQICVGGIGVGRGYVNDAGRTAALFVPDPYSWQEGGRLYKTGDLGRYLPDGQIEFLGRLDQQIKLRGYRIELEEIEAVLEQHPQVQEGVVIVREDTPEDKRIVAYVVPDLTVQAFDENVSELKDEHISQWQTLWAETYRHSATFSDPTLNVIGWDSSYTGRPMPVEEVNEQVEHAVARILARHPQRVMEIGVGSGMLLFRIAPHCTYYYGSDFSTEALNYVRQVLGAGSYLQVHLQHYMAHEATNVSAETFDAVILNSVVQYFPDIDYLAQVLEGAVAALRAGGTLFVGDIRSLSLLRAYCASVEFYQASEVLTREELRQRVLQRVAEEEELLVDPAFFTALQKVLPRMGQVQVLLKRGRAHNELTRFRYDVVVRIQGSEESEERPVVVDWQLQNWTLETLQQYLQERAPKRLSLRRVPNTRLQQEGKTLEWLSSEKGPETVGAWREQLLLEGMVGPELEDLWQLGEQLGYSVQIGWSADGKSEYCEVELCQGSDRALQLRAVQAPAQKERVANGNWLRYANHPLQGKMTRRIIPRLQRYLREQLPEYMVPASLLMLERLPLTPNGKIDRRALPDPEVSLDEKRAGIGEARSPIEEVVLQVWIEVLGRSQIGMQDNFFDLGGHSLLATQVVARIRRILEVDIPVRSMFEAPTVTTLAARVEQELRQEHEMEMPPLVSIAREQDLQLSFAQQRLWFLDQLYSGNIAYNIPSAVYMQGLLNMAVMDQSLQEMVRRHESLRTTFHTVEGQPIQIIASPAPYFVPLVDLSSLGVEEREAEARRLARQEARAFFNLSYGPLFRTRVLRLRTDEHVFLLTMYHIISDGWSMGVFVREVSTLYNAFFAGRPSPLPELPIQYADFAAWQRQWLQGRTLEKQLDYWTHQLSGVEPLAFPTDHPRPAIQGHHGALYSFVLSPTVSSELKALSHTEGATLFMTLLAAFQTLLYRYTGQNDIVVGSDIANRTQLETESLIGFFVNLLVLRADFRGGPSFREVLRRVRRVVLGAYTYQDTPFEMLVEKLAPKHTLDRMPLVQVLFVLQNVPDVNGDLTGVRVGSYGGEVTTTKFDIGMFMRERANRLEGSIIYDTDLFTESTLETLVNRFILLLQSIVAAPDSPVDIAEIYSPEEKARLARVEKERHKGVKMSRGARIDLSKIDPAQS